MNLTHVIRTALACDVPPLNRLTVYARAEKQRRLQQYRGFASMCALGVAILVATVVVVPSSRAATAGTIADFVRSLTRTASSHSNAKRWTLTPVISKCPVAFAHPLVGIRTAGCDLISGVGSNFWRMKVTTPNGNVFVLIEPGKIARLSSLLSTVGIQASVPTETFVSTQAVHVGSYLITAYVHPGYLRTAQQIIGNLSEQ